MSDWAWITLGYGITYAAVGGYLALLRHRRRTLEPEGDR